MTELAKLTQRRSELLGEMRRILDIYGRDSQEFAAAAKAEANAREDAYRCLNKLAPRGANDIR